jgi:hypothetical protein
MGTFFTKLQTSLIGEFWSAPARFIVSCLAIATTVVGLPAYFYAYKEVSELPQARLLLAILLLISAQGMASMFAGFLYGRLLRISATGPKVLLFIMLSIVAGWATATIGGAFAKALATSQTIYEMTYFFSGFFSVVLHLF